ncbi:MAG: adenosine kinase [Gemmatimonadetes bacterium]|mgnify:CR=1 FL=1|nr:adenosine kinase [Gemmatimonadota bacterium]MBT6148095.1 adenosine kinase [Gemmatimonadota bacterium]MBT7861522.1 adenosine kinase [Gemmatimonadota bacterium]
MPQYDVYGIGHALVDIQYSITPDALARVGVEKGVMTLVDDARRQEILAGMSEDPILSASGGSAANTMITVARFGGRSCYAYQVGDDDWGRFYRKDLGDAGVDSGEGVFLPSTPTGQCLVMVTPDADRSMNTFLGASGSMGPQQVDEVTIAQARFVYLEGYLLTTDEGFAACERAATAARSQGVAVSLTLSDPLVVGAFQSRFERLIDSGVDLLFCNEDEAMALSGQPDRNKAAEALAARVGRAFITCGADGALVCTAGEHRLVAGHTIDAVDTTGAGDSFAGGVLYGLCRDLSPEASASLGNYAAACVVSAYGPRLRQSLGDRVDEIIAGTAPAPTSSEEQGS